MSPATPSSKCCRVFWHLVAVAKLKTDTRTWKENAMAESSEAAKKVDAQQQKEEEVDADLARNDTKAGGPPTKKRTIRDFYSLSPTPTAQAPRQTSDGTVASKRRRTARRCAEINAGAKPILVSIPCSGRAETSLVTISSHCVDSRFGPGEEPVVLTGSYDRRSVEPLRRFLQGFGRYIH